MHDFFLKHNIPTIKTERVGSEALINSSIISMKYTQIYNNFKMTIKCLFCTDTNPHSFQIKSNKIFLFLKLFYLIFLFLNKSKMINIFQFFVLFSFIISDSSIASGSTYDLHDSLFIIENKKTTAFSKLSNIQPKSYPNILILSASFIVSGNFLFRVSGRLIEKEQPINPQVPNTTNGKLGMSRVSL